MPLAHGSTTLEPSQYEPAGHRLHVVRVVLSPPEVCEPGGQVLQLLAPSPLYFVSSSHAEQSLSPAATKYPAAQTRLMLVPSQDEPAGHSVQLVRVVFAPPDVTEPTGHTSQLPASFEP